VPERRTLEPWGVLSWRRRWYVAGLDRDRREPRSFRLSRITGTVEIIGAAGEYERPADVRLLDLVAGRSEDTRDAHVRVTGPGAGQLRRLAERADGDVLTLTFSDAQWLARVITGAGASVRVLDPPELVDAVVARLAASAEAGW